MAAVLESYPDGQFGAFLGNHDMTRVMTQLGDDPQKARLAAAILLTSPGVPFIYYGEEIGLTGAKPDDVDLRRPMQWDGSPSAGFTSGAPWVAPGTHDPSANVAAQTDDPSSLLSQYRTLIALRQEHAALRAGETWGVDSSVPQVYSLLRQSGGETLLILANLSNQPVKGYKLALDSGPLKGRVKASLLFGEGAPASPALNAHGGFSAYTPLAEIPPYGVAILTLQ
jgi:alpha-amylase